MTYLEQIENTFDLINDNFDVVYSKCNDTQKTQLVSLRDAARDAYWHAAAENLSDDHDLVKQTSQELDTANTQIQSGLQNLKDVVSFLNLVAQGVKLAGALAALAAA